MQGNQEKLSNLIQRFEQALIENGYSEDSLCRYRKVLNELLEFAKDELYSQKICSDFLVDRLEKTGGFVPKGDYSKTQMYYLRTVRALADYYNFGTIFRRKDIKGFIIWPESFREPIEKYLNKLVENRFAQRYIRENELTLKEFILNLDARSVFCLLDIKPEHVSGFISSAMVGYAPKTISRKVSILRCLFRYLYFEEYISFPLEETLPKVFNCARTTLPTVWSSEDIRKILNVVDRGNPNGKRDYAIVLMIARLGLRIGDVRGLKLCDIDWHKNLIKFRQNKTGNHLSLPLLEDVGWAVIDYLKNGRPVTDSPYLFVRHLPPFLPFSSNNNLHGMITTIITKAGIPVENKPRKGMHSLRHSLASGLMQNNVEVSTISGILGHSGPETVRHYLRVDIPALRQCALEVEVI